MSSFPYECQLRNVENWPNKKYDQGVVENERSSKVFGQKIDQDLTEEAKWIV